MSTLELQQPPDAMRSVIPITVDSPRLCGLQLVGVSVIDTRINGEGPDIITSVPITDHTERPFHLQRAGVFAQALRGRIIIVDFPGQGIPAVSKGDTPEMSLLMAGHGDPAFFRPNALTEKQMEELANGRFQAVGASMLSAALKAVPDIDKKELVADGYSLAASTVLGMLEAAEDRIRVSRLSLRANVSWGLPNFYGRYMRSMGGGKQYRSTNPEWAANPNNPGLSAILPASLESMRYAIAAMRRGNDQAVLSNKIFNGSDVLAEGALVRIEHGIDSPIEDLPPGNASLMYNIERRRAPAVSIEVSTVPGTHMRHESFTYWDQAARALR